MLLNPSLAIAQAVLSRPLRFMSLQERWIITSLPAYRSGLPSASGLSCGLPPALSVIDTQSIRSARASSLAKSRVAVALASSIVPRVVTNSTPRAKWSASIRMEESSFISRFKVPTDLHRPLDIVRRRRRRDGAGAGENEPPQRVARRLQDLRHVLVHLLLVPSEE